MIILVGFIIRWARKSTENNFFMPVITGRLDHRRIHVREEFTFQIFYSVNEFSLLVQDSYISCYIKLNFVGGEIGSFIQRIFKL
jgi:hypothetical protein